MQSENRLTPPEHELELTLGSLQPATASIDRDRLMFRAGQVSLKRRSRVWQTATVMLAVAFAASLAIRPNPREIERIVYVTDEPDASPSQHWSTARVRPWYGDGQSTETEYLRLRQLILAQGIEGLPSIHGVGETPDDSVDLLEQWLDIPAGSLLRQTSLGT